VRHGNQRCKTLLKGLCCTILYSFTVVKDDKRPKLQRFNVTIRGIVYAFLRPYNDPEHNIKPYII